MKATTLIVQFFTFAISSSAVLAQNAPHREYVFSRAPLAQGINAELPLGSIKAKGWLLKQLELQRDGATGHAEELYAEKDNLGPETDWLGGKGNSWERVPYYVKGLVALAYTLDDPGLKAKAEKWISWTLNSQQENGLFGPPKMEDWWPRMPMMYALKDYYEATGDKKVIGFLTRYLKYQHENLAKAPLREWSKSRTGDNIEIALWVFNKTGEHFLLDLIDDLKARAYPWKDIYANNRFYHFGDDFHTKHAVSVGQALKFPALAYERSKDKTYKNAFEKGIEHLMRDHGHSSGIASGTEFLAGRSSIQGTETCTVVEWMQSLETSARIFGSTETGDRLEKIAFNTLPAQFSRDIKSHLYYSQPNQVFCKEGNVGFDEDYSGGILLSPYSGMGCCRYNMHMGWPYFVKNSWVATPDGGLEVIAYAPVEVDAVVGDGARITVTEETNYPFDEKIVMAIKLDKSAKFPLKLRMPSWCATPLVSVNGKKVSGRAGELLVLNRRWQNGDKVELQFPMKVTVESQVNNSVSIERGPLVYALQINAKYTSIKEHPVKGFHDYEVSPASPWNYGLVLDRGNLSKSVTVEKGGMPANPFVQKETPVKLKVKARKIPHWTLAYNKMYAFEVPASPLLSNEPLEEVTLVPYGSENIRISCFPEIGTPPAPEPSFTAKFDEQGMEQWIIYGGGWFVKDGAVHAASNAGSWGFGIHGSKAVAAATHFEDLVFTAEVAVGTKGNAGLIFRVTNPAIGADFYEGYYVGLDPVQKKIELGKASGQKYTVLATATASLETGKKYRVKVTAKGPEIKVGLEGTDMPVLTARDEQFKSGSIGIRSYDALATIDNIEVKAVKD